MLAYLAAFLHEGAHSLAGIYFGIFPLGAEADIFGLRLFIPPVNNTKIKLAIYFAGPLASFLIFLYLYIIGRIFDIELPLYNFFTYANIFIGFINLFPVYPLDGAVILKTLASAKMGIIRSIRVCRWVAVFFLGFIAGLNALFIKEGEPNLSLVMILVFLVFSIKNHREISLKERKAVLSGEIISKKKIRYFACDASSELLCIASYISCDYSLLVAAFKGERFYGEIYQHEITEGIKAYGALCTAEDYIRLRDRG